MNKALAISLALAATPVAALEPAAPCVFDMEAARLISAGATRTPVQLDVYPWSPAEGFAAYEAGVPDNKGGYLDLMVLDHCASGQELIVTITGDRAGAALDLWSDLLESETQYTMRQLAARMKAAGATARLGSETSGRCACAVLGWL